MHWRLLPLLMLFVGLAHFNRISITVAGAEHIIKDDLLSAQQMGVVYSTFLVVYTLFMMPGGWFIDRFGPRLAWLVVILGSVIFTGATGLAGFYLQDSLSLFVGLLLIRGAMGMTNSPLHPTAARLVGNWFPATASDLANGAINCGALICIALTYVVFGAMSDWLGWPGGFLLSAAFTFALALVWSWVGADYPHATHSQALPASARQSLDATSPRRNLGLSSEDSPDIALPANPWGRLLAHRSLICLTLSYAAQGYYQYLIFYWVQYYFDTMNLPAQESRLYSTFIVLANGVGMAVGGALSDQIRSRHRSWGATILVPMVGLAGGGILFLAGLLVEAAFAIAVLFAASMFAAGLSEGPFWSRSVEIGGSHGGTAAAILNTGGNAGGLVAPFLTPILGEVLGWKWGLAFGGGMCLLAALLWLGVTEEASRSPGPHAERDNQASPGD